YQAVPNTDAEAVLDTAWSYGIRYYDTAPHYGFGLSERRFGDYLRTKPRDSYVLSTKVGRLLKPVPEDQVPKLG
ncbi:aldo/keto reductase, partial [Proteus mirabilis]